MSGESGDQEMNQNDRRRYLIEELLEERPEYVTQIAYEYKNAEGN